ncbi:hypothetical protein B0T13DRAFT_149881 [Neurospora crassa]|nr:hypothetical protein B0T13DRAFT_149881 [Neurospora crassa]
MVNVDIEPTVLVFGIYHTYPTRIEEPSRTIPKQDERPKEVPPGAPDFGSSGLGRRKEKILATPSGPSSVRPLESRVSEPELSQTRYLRASPTRRGQAHTTADGHLIWSGRTWKHGPDPDNDKGHVAGMACAFIHPYWGFGVRITIWLVKGGTLCYLSLFILFHLFYVVFFFGSLSFLAVPEIESLHRGAERTGLGAKQT